MKNSLEDLYNLMFAQLELLGDEDMGEVQLRKEIDRSKAMAQVGAVMVKSAGVMLAAQKLLGSGEVEVVPRILQDPKPRKLIGE